MALPTSGFRQNVRIDTQVVIVGGGPAGLLLSHLLHLGGIESVVLERQTRQHVMERIRAGVLEFGTTRVLRDAGLGERMLREGFIHRGVAIAFGERVLRIDFKEATDKYVTIYGQTEVQKDLFAAADARGGLVIDRVDEVVIHDADTESPYVTFVRDGTEERLDAVFVAGCDGSHGVSRETIPAEVLTTYERDYPFGWLGVLSETPPVSSELIYANSARGFALCSMRNPHLSRYYVQCPLDTTVEDWPDDRFWTELKSRLPRLVSNRMVTGPSIEKSITPLRSFVAEPLRFGNLFLAGDAGHVVPPTGAKGLNLAVSDVVYLSRAFTDFFKHKSEDGINRYSEQALRRVWKAVRFSWWMTTMLHRFPDDGEFGLKIQHAELDYLASSKAAQTALAENYIGLPFS